MTAGDDAGDAGDDTRLALFAACLPGLEPLLVNELARLAIATDPRPEAGGVAWRGDRTSMMRANLELGLATHVLVRVGTFTARNLHELVPKTAPLPWPELLRTDRAFEVRATCRKSRLYHSGAVAQRVRDAIASALGSVAPEPGCAAGDAPKPGTSNGDAAGPPRAEGSGPVTVVARVLHDRVTLSLDTSGEPLHRRGWRRQPGPAPVREDLARALLEAAAWTGDTALLDPMAGAGTIVIEAASLARRLAPGRLRRFAFEETGLFDEAAWQAVRAAAEARVRRAAGVEIAGSDRDERALAAAQANAERAGVADRVVWRQSPLSAALPDGLAERGLLATHPPFGRRLGDAARLGGLYHALGALARRLPAGWRVALLAGDRRLALRTGLELHTAFLTDHGGQKVRALLTPEVPHLVSSSTD